MTSPVSVLETSAAEPQPLAGLDSFGPAEDFAATYRRFAGPIRGYLHQRVGPDLAEDLTQETFMRAYSKLDQFEDRGNGIGPWLYAIARSRLSTHYRKTGSRNAAEAKAAFYEPSLQAELADPEERAMGRVSLQEAFRCLDSSPIPGLRTAVETICVLDMTHEEHAETVGIAVGTSKSRLFRARKLLARQQENDELLEVSLN